MIYQVTVLVCLVITSSTWASKKVERNALPREIFRDDVEPKRGGKVPEAAKDPERIELNKQDAVGLNRDQDNEVFDSDAFESGFFNSPFGDEDYLGSDFPYSPIFDPIKISGSAGESYPAAEEPAYTNPYAVMYDSLFNKPKPKKPKKKSGKDTYKYIDIEAAPAPPQTQYSSYQEPPGPGYEAAPYQPYIEPASYEPPHDPSYDYNAGYDYYGPPGDYAPPAGDAYDGYSPPPKDAYAPPAPAYEPEPYLPPKPVGPVLLEKRPYEVKSVQPLPITVSEPHTSFDCRNKQPGRHYADPEAGCQVYHFCHHDGKQDTFQCGQHTVFNEYIGTCDYRSNVHCAAGPGYTPAAAPHHPAPPHHHQSSYGGQYHEPEQDFFSNNNQNISPFTNFGPF